MKNKYCPRCGITKSVDRFSRSRKRKDGLAGWCKACKAAEYQEKRLERRAQQAEYKAANRLRLAEKQREYCRAHKAEDYARSQAWKAANRERARILALSYVHRKRDGVGLDVDYCEVLRADPCSYCGGRPPGTMQVDHIVPVIAGGNGEWENLTAACGHCNKSKNARPLLSFLLDA